MLFTRKLLHRTPVTAGDRITILALGRGVREDGTLSPYCLSRVRATLEIAGDLRQRGADIQIIWTGGMNRAQANAGGSIGGLGSEGAAMMEYAHLCGSTFSMRAEVSSTSTVENMANSAPLIRPGDTVVVVTDNLHYRFNRVRFVAWVTLPNHRMRYVRIPSQIYGWKQLTAQMVSTIVTMLGMSGVQRGNLSAIKSRQHRLQRLTGH